MTAYTRILLAGIVGRAGYYEKLLLQVESLANFGVVNWKGILVVRLHQARHTTSGHEFQISISRYHLPIDQSSGGSKRRAAGPPPGQKPAHCGPQMGTERFLICFNDCLFSETNICLESTEWPPS